MLQTLRDNSQGIIAKVLVGFIVVVFALWGVDSLVGLATAEPPPAEVNGVEISRQDLFRGIELQRRQVLSQLGANADPALLDEGFLRASVLSELVDRTLSVESAESQGLFVSEQMLDQLIVSTPDFQIDGRFDRDQFELVLRSAGYTPLSYRQLLREDTLIGQERRAYSTSAFLTQQEVSRLLDLNRQTRDIRYVQISPNIENVEITEAELEAEYASRADQLQVPEQLIVDYVMLEQRQFSNPDSVTEAEINGAYQQIVASFEAQEERSASHILFEVGDTQSIEDALAKAEAVRQEFEAGADFAELAEKYSQDIGSAQSGGDLGYLTPGLFEGPFDDALFALNAGEISQPVESAFGVHLILVNDIRRPEAPSLADQEADLRQQIAASNAEGEYVVALERLTDLSFSSGDLVAPAEELGLEILTSEPFSRTSGTELFANARIQAAAFSETVLDEKLNSDPIEIDPGRAIVLRLKERIAARQQSLDEVRDLLLADMKQIRAAENTAAEAREILAAAKRGDSQVEWSIAAEVSRAAAPELDPKIVEAGFALAKPEGGVQHYTQVQLFDGSNVVLTVDAVGVAEDGVDAEQITPISRMLAARRGDLSYQRQFEAYKDNAEIVFN